ncbi:MAG: restriction endonuclease [Rudaea sp.]
MSVRHKNNRPFTRVAILFAGGLLAVGLTVILLADLAARLGLVRDAFVVAEMAALAGLAVYALLLSGWIIIRRRAQREQVIRAIKLADVDAMSGTAFEEYVARLLTSQGYRVTRTGHPGDMGVDLVAGRPPDKYAVQVKRQASPVSRRAVSDAVAATAHYRCNAAMVVSNSSFTAGARELAHSTGCRLVDRETLGGWIAAFQNGAKS